MQDKKEVGEIMKAINLLDFASVQRGKRKDSLWEAPGKPVKPFPEGFNPPSRPDKLRLAALPVVTGAAGCRSICLLQCKQR